MKTLKRKKALTLPAARREIRSLTEQITTSRNLREGDQQYFRTKLQEMQAKLDDKEDKLLPQKHLLLKELSFLVNATSRAVRTTMWSLAPEKRRGW